MNKIKNIYYKFWKWLINRIVNSKEFTNEREIILEQCKICSNLKELQNEHEILQKLINKTIHNKKYIEGKDYSLFCISNRPALYREVKSLLKNNNLKYFNGDGYPSFAKLVNDCVSKCETDIIILTSDKMQPNENHIEKILNLLDLGFGFVGLHSFGFFGFRRSLFSDIGPLDERFIGGEFEDVDFFLRLKESNIASYNARELGYVGLKSSWKHNESQKWFKEKWKEKEGNYIRQIEDEIYPNYIWPEENNKYLDSSYSITKYN